MCRRHYQRKWARQSLPPKPERERLVKMMVRLPEGQHKAMTKLSRVTGLTLAKLIRDAVDEYARRYNAPVAVPS